MPVTAVAAGAPDMARYGAGMLWVPQRRMQRRCGGYAGKVAVARIVPVVVTSRAPVSGPLVTGSGLPQ